MSFKLNIEIQKTAYNDSRWTVSYHTLPSLVFDEKFFIGNYNIIETIEEGETTKYQEIPFNNMLSKEIGKLLFPASIDNYLIVTKEEAYNFWHYCTFAKFISNVHPCSVSGDFFRMEIEGSQEEIYARVKAMADEWIKKE